MKNILQLTKKLSLIQQIMIGMAVGILLGLAFPQATFIETFGNLFVGALKAIAPLLVFFIVVAALAQQKEGHSSNMKTIVGLYLFGTFIAAFIGVIATFLLPVKIVLHQATTDIAAPEGIGAVMQTLLLKLVDNPVNALATANYIGILAWAVVFGIALRQANDATKALLHTLSEATSQAVRWIISLAPLGIMGLVYATVATNGLEGFTDYGMLLVALLGSMAFVAFIANPLIVYVLLRRNPYPLVWRCVKESGITAFFTRSSAANIPVNMELCRKLGLDEDTYSVSIPLGATINMSGAAITITVLTLAAVQTLGIQVDFLTALVLSLVATVSACGASGVTGGSLLLIPVACSLFGISNDIAMQVVGVGFIIGVIQDSCETALNSSMDVLFTAVAEYVGRKKRGEHFEM